MVSKLHVIDELSHLLAGSLAAHGDLALAVLHELEAAERAVRHLMGARGVTNSICLAAARPHSERRRTTDQIRNEIEEAIRRCALIHSTGISVEVDRHTVILTGDVHSHAEHDAVERIAWTARGISSVENCITITPWGRGPMDEWGY